MVGDQSEFGEAEVPEDLAANAQLPLIHGHHLGPNAVGPGKIGGIHIFRPAIHLMQGSGNLKVPRLGTHVDECTTAFRIDHSQRRFQVLLAGVR